MSIFSELIPKIKEISKSYTSNYNDDLKVAFDLFDKFQEEFHNGRTRGWEKAQKEKFGSKNLQSINEDDGEANKVPDGETNLKSDKGSSGRGSLDSGDDQRASKKRSKNEVDDMLSPEQGKRQKRNASVKAQSIITEQVNVNLNAKLRRENTNEKISSQSSKGRRRKEDEKENAEPHPVLSKVLVPAIEVKLEKISLPPEPIDIDPLPLNIGVKQEVNKDDIAMPPPAMPVRKPRKALVEEKSDDETVKRRTTRTKKQSETVSSQPPEPHNALVRENSNESADEDTGTGKRRTTRTKKQSEMPSQQPVVGVRSTRASSRVARSESEESSTEAIRPKRTRGRKKVSQAVSTEVDGAQTPQESGSATSSPAEKPRPKRTRRGKAADKQEVSKPVEPITSPKEDRPEISSPILQKDTKSKKRDKMDATIEPSIVSGETHNVVMDATKVISIRKDMDETVVIPNGVYNHAPVTPQSVRNMNETVVIDKINNETVVIEKRPIIMDATVVLEKIQISSHLTEDNSLITDDESENEAYTPPKNNIPLTQPSSAVKEKVQQFEEMASRVTRTKTRAMAKKEEQSENLTPPDKIVKPILSAETLTKMNSLIFMGKTPQISSSASKPRAVVPVTKSQTSSTSKLSSVSRHKEAAEEGLKNSEDARRKKEAMLEAKRELQKRKREEKMAAAAAARNAAERERKAALEAAAKERMEKQAHADAGKLERLKEAERKKQELARKVLETEERRRAEESARMQRLAEEQRKANALRRKQLEEQEAMKKEAAIMAKEIEKRQKEYIEKQKMKQRLEDKMHTQLRTPGTPGGYACAVEPVYMADGFQHLHSDEEEPAPRPVPDWSTSKVRKHQLDIQSHLASVHISRLFSVRVHSPDLREIFPNIERSRLKRTSSAMWRTPPQQLAPLTE